MKNMYFINGYTERFESFAEKNDNIILLNI